jgi:hypothetical protein
MAFLNHSPGYLMKVYEILFLLLAHFGAAINHSVWIRNTSPYLYILRKVSIGSRTIELYKKYGVYAYIVGF